MPCSQSNESETQETEKPTLFLETTIQIERIVGSPERREKIRNQLTSKSLKTSTFVLREFKERLLHKCILLLELVLCYEHRADVETAISQMFSDTKILLQLWAQVQRDADNIVSLTELSDYVKAEVPKWGFKSGKQQTPVFKSYITGEIILAGCSGQ